MSLSRYGISALGIDDPEAFNASFISRFLHSSLGQKKVSHNLHLMQEAMEKVYRAISHDGQRGVRLSISSVRTSIDGETVDRAPLEDMIACITEQSRHSFRLVELPGGEKALYFDPEVEKKASGRPPKGSEHAVD